MSRKPSYGLTKKEKSRIVKQARRGHDFGKRGKNFGKIEKKAAKRYHSKAAGRRVAGAIFWRSQAKRKRKRR